MMNLFSRRRMALEAIWRQGANRPVTIELRDEPEAKRLRFELYKFRVDYRRNPIDIEFLGTMEGMSISLIQNPFTGRRNTVRVGLAEVDATLSNALSQLSPEFQPDFSAEGYVQKSLDELRKMVDTDDQRHRDTPYYKVED